MTEGDGGGEDDDTDVDSEAWKEKGSYEAGYTEALSDLHRGFYEGWVTKQSGDFEDMAEFIVEAIREYKDDTNEEYKVSTSDEPVSIRGGSDE